MDDSELRDVAWLLRPDDLEQLYIELQLPTATVENAKCSEVSTDVRHKALAVLKEWRRENGSGASKTVVLRALWRDKCIDAMQSLQTKWDL